VASLEAGRWKAALHGWRFSGNSRVFKGLALVTALLLCCAYARRCSPACPVFDGRSIDPAGTGKS